MPKLTAEVYRGIRARLIELGYGDEIWWQATCRPPEDPEAFAAEVIYVICASGMRQQTARVIYNRIVDAMLQGRGPATVFRHALKCRAIEAIWNHRRHYFESFTGAPSDTLRLQALRQIDGVGPIVVYHLAKNFGMDVAKPDRHLVRLAEAEGCSPQVLCERLAGETGDRVAVVDLVLWRACNLGLLQPARARQEGS